MVVRLLIVPEVKWIIEGAALLLPALPILTEIILEV
jgi:hypothetical protein